MDFGLEDWNVGDPITAARLQREKEALQKIANFLGAGAGGDVFQTLGGTAFKGAGEGLPAPDRFVLLRLDTTTTPTLGIGWYWAFLVERNETAFDPTTNFATSTYYTSGERVLMVNEIEIGSGLRAANSAGAPLFHAFDLQETAPVTLSGASEATDYPVYVATGVAIFC